MAFMSDRSAAQEGQQVRVERVLVRRGVGQAVRAARDAFDALGMSAWAERARQELGAAGESSQRRERDSLDELTPQELQIVQIAGKQARDSCLIR